MAVAGAEIMDKGGAGAEKINYFGSATLFLTVSIGKKLYRYAVHMCKWVTN